MNALQLVALLVEYRIYADAIGSIESSGGEVSQYTNDHIRSYIESLELYGQLPANPPLPPMPRGIERMPGADEVRMAKALVVDAGFDGRIRCNARGLPSQRYVFRLNNVDAEGNPIFVQVRIDPDTGIVLQIRACV